MRGMGSPAITLRCDCGAEGKAAYGEVWKCAKCGRSYDTSQMGAVGRVSPLLRQHRNDPLLPPAPADGGSRDRPVILATLAVPFDPDSARVAIQAAMEGGVKLIVVDAVEMPFWPQSLATRRADLEEESDRDAIRALVQQTAGLGLEVEHLV